MKELKFRNLRPDEIEVRPTDTKYKGSALLLLYQNARCAMNILDETVGSDWQNDYKDINGNIYCGIGIKIDNEWVWRWDCGAFNAKDDEIQSKADASDSFKRAAVRWGLGRELYYTPKVRIKCPESYYFNGKMNMTFSVNEISFEGNVCTKLVVTDKFGNVVYTYGQRDDSPGVTDKGGLVPKQVYASIRKANTVDELTAIWNANSDLQTLPAFKRELGKRKAELGNE